MTYNPETSTVLRARAAGMFAATAAVFPPVMATSRTALIMFLASRT